MDTCDGRTSDCRDAVVRRLRCAHLSPFLNNKRPYPYEFVPLQG